MIGRVKNYLTHPKSNSLRWRFTERVWGRYARGKACSFYWVKLPTAIVGIVILGIYFPIRMVFRALVIAIKWFFGYRFYGRITDFNSEVLESWSYDKYKEREDGTHKRYAPWEFALIPLLLVMLWYLGLVNTSLGKIVLYGVIVVVILAAIVYFVTRNWKDPQVVRARTSLSGLWDRVCPPLEVNFVTGDD